MSDWSLLTGALAKLGTPAGTLLGTLIGGPAGAAIGKAAGTVLAEALGVDDTPEAVAEAVKADPMKAEDALTSPQMQAAIAQAQAEMIKTVNETYRIELQQESWVVRLWRPVCGWCLALVWTVHGIALGKAIWFKEYEVIKVIADLFVFYTVMGGVVGVAAWGRTAEKKAGVSTADTIAETIGAVIKRAKK
jgi:gas vesicle protein